MYKINSGGLSGFGQNYLPTAAVAQGTLPKVPLTANAILPRGSQYATGLRDPAGRTEFAGLDGNWEEWGQNLLTQGIQDTTAIIGGILSNVGNNKVVRGAGQALVAQHTAPAAVTTQVTGTPTVEPTPASPPAQQQGMTPEEMYALMQASQAPMPPEKKGLPIWAWALIGVGGVAAVGGVLYFTVFKK